MARTKEAPAANRALTAFLDKMGKVYGTGKFILNPPVVPYKVISTGVMDLDIKLRVGGWIVGRIHEVWGMEGAGKTLLALLSIVEAQKAQPDRVCGFIDMEHRFDEPWAILQGVDLSRLVKVPTDDAESVADMVKDMCRSGLFSLIVVDSVGAMISKKEIEKDAEQDTVGLQAKLVTRMVKIAAPSADATDTTVLLINQVRANVGGYGAATTTGGGFALRHCTTTKVKASRTEPIKMRIGGEEVPVGYKHAFKVERNSVAPAGRTAETVVFNLPTEKYGPVGIDKADEAATVGIASDVILQQGGGYYVLTPTGERVRGRDAVLEALRADPDLVAAIRTRALAALAGEVIANAAPVDIEDEETADVE